MLRAFTAAIFLLAGTAHAQDIHPERGEPGHEGTEPVRIPFCARQTFGALRRRTSAGMVAARELPMVEGASRLGILS